MNAKCDHCGKVVNKFVIIQGKVLCYECLNKEAMNIVHEAQED